MFVLSLQHLPKLFLQSPGCIVQVCTYGWGPVTSLPVCSLHQHVDWTLVRLTECKPLLQPAQNER